MIKQKQLFKHNPPHTFGDCQRTVLACLLNKAPEEIPNFGELYYEQDGFHSAVLEYLATQGLDLVSIPFSGDLDLSQLLTSFGHCNPDRYYMLSGKSKNGTNHVVICLNAQIYHDPAIDNSGVVGPCTDGYYWIDLIVPGFMKALV